MLKLMSGVAAVFAVVGAGAAVAAPSLAEPSLSPDGREIAFVSGGDIWTAPAEGGTASLLVTDPGTESRPLFSPDGTRLAFTSTRGGSANIYVLTLATGALNRITWSDANELLDGWSRDGKWLYFSSSAGDVARQNDIYRVAATGGTPLEVSRERFQNEFGAAPSPDGSSIALTAKGMSSVQWWRHGRSHIDQTEVWVKPVAANAPYRRVMASEAKTLWPMWTPDGASLYAMSDRTGPENIWRLPVNGGAPEQVTRFTDGRVLWPSISNDGRFIVFERDFGVWRLDTRTGQAAAVPITLRGSPAGAGVKRLSETSFQGMALSPDGLKVAVVAHGEVFAAPAKDGGQAQRISETAGEERDVAWSPDSRRLVYVSQRGLDSQLVEYDFATRRERVLTSGAGLASVPAYSPDGKRIAYVRADRELRVVDPSASGAARDRAVFTGALWSYGGASLAWAPDSQWLAFFVTDRKSFRNVHVVPAAGGTARPVSFLANGQTGRTIAWAPDGKFLIFDTAQRSEDAKMVRVDLLPNVPKHREDVFRELFTPGQTPDQPSPATTPDTQTSQPAQPAEPAEPATRRPDPEAVLAAASTPAKPKGKTPPSPVRIVFEGIRERASILPLGLNAQDPVISPDGKTLVFRASTAGQDNLFSYSLDELSKEPPVPGQLTSTKKPKRDWGFTPDGKSVFFLEGGVVTTTPIESPKTKPVPVTAEMDVDFDQEKMVVFDQAWGGLNRRFYDPNFHGADWAAIRTRWAPRIQAARTSDEMRRLLNLMVGELNASHLGVNSPPTPGGPTPRTGDLGLRFDREAYEAGRGLVVREVVALGPAFLEGSIRPGDTLVSVNGRAIERDTNLDFLLQHEVGKRVVLGVRPAGGTRVREAVVRPVGAAVAAGLLYRQWVNERRAYVDRISGGRLGYVHVADMGDASLDQLYIDLDAENQGKQGVVLDLRHNNGGYVNGRVLDVFTRQNFLMMTPRDLFAVPSRQSLGQRALGAPTVLVVNESSLSDAEDFTEGYRTLGVGKVVGVPTAGWIIYTSNQPMIDGSIVRLPQTRVEDLRGQNMELNPRPVDIRVERPLGETLTGRDAQLDAAVASLLSTVQGSQGGPAAPAAR